MEHLHSLSLRNTDITDNGLVHLKTLKALTSLDLYDTRVSDQGLAHLKDWPRLEVLVLGMTQLTDSSPITDASIEHLKSMASLKEVGLYRTRVTKDGRQRTREDLANVQNHWIFHLGLAKSTGEEQHRTGSTLLLSTLTFNNRLSTIVPYPW